MKQRTKREEELIEIYLDTIEMSNMLGGARPVVTKHYYQDDFINDRQVVKPKVHVEPLDSVSMLQMCKEKGGMGKIALLNMASYKRAGGGVKRGATAQEECLYRCSNLGTLSEEGLYPLEDNSAIYTTDATFIKDFRYGEITPINCDVLTIAAYNQQKENLKYFANATIEDAFYDKIKFMFQLAGHYKVDTLLLGAFGCGVYDNDPEFIAGVFKKVIQDGNTFGVSTIIFPVINDRNSVGNNFSIFKRILNGI